ncbi:DUF2075 domain-containing protein [Parvibaculum sp.]|uniref:DUF2075 domain-containing protein n=1 Tax=Parvibaculum sp. TaxID=2024848 RepID=UPI001B105A2B|nr:DUF2075 domain-containing protein [Parvibaculum sp.]MBO6633130.1 DUF2075 domain-containing protein [Parvibaculum sp.]MBO6679634.1 DUF2075 domain-containing protein [Parvibaculum sp.]MBO6686585.1 DUF2075 domain-containing protein [Parvibaculum sp.]
MIKRSYYQANVQDFILESPEAILGKLAKSHHFALEVAQRQAWLAQIENLQNQLQPLSAGEIFFEFAIPRMGKRVDVVLQIGDIVHVIEYKVGASEHTRQATDQVLDYALDLKNFHETSEDKYIAPILVSTKAAPVENHITYSEDKVASPLRSNGQDLYSLIKMVNSQPNDNKQDFSPVLELSENEREPFEKWADGRYKPTPTIVEAAQALYGGHSVEEISRSDAGTTNLSVTSNRVLEIIKQSRRERRKSICFVTGVPGSGKTLAGLNISTLKSPENEEHAVFLSGNGPLVKVLQEALARDELVRAKHSGSSVTKKQALQSVKAFVQNIHHFRDEGLRSDKPPIEHVVVFDEAQRAWNQAQAESFMRQKKGVRDFDMSEPEFLISLMDRRPDWAVIVCLVGGGQEINKGEAGLTEWFDALKKRFRHWDIYHSGQFSDESYAWGRDFKTTLSELEAVENPELHLSVSLRSYRAEKLAEFVNRIIEGDSQRAKAIHSTLTNYPIAITRDINAARKWLREHARGTERLGLVASSGAMRLKPEGVHIRAKIDPANWFLNGKEDVRSSYYLEEVATEFDIQGLELDWIGVCWDADYRKESKGWGTHSFKGTKWQSVKDPYSRRYLANAYRVILTRARQGMVIFVPRGDPKDPTREPDFYDKTFAFLRACGLEEYN